MKILLGKDRGKDGTVEFVRASDNRIFVNGINLYKRHVKKQGQIEGGIIDIPKSIDVSNVALVCPDCKKVTRIGYKQSKDLKIRICRKCGSEITGGKK